MFPSSLHPVLAGIFLTRMGGSGLPCRRISATCVGWEHPQGWRERPLQAGTGFWRDSWGHPCCCDSSSDTERVASSKRPRVRPDTSSWSLGRRQLCGHSQHCVSPAQVDFIRVKATSPHRGYYEQGLEFLPQSLELPHHCFLPAFFLETSEPFYLN